MSRVKLFYFFLLLLPTLLCAQKGTWTTLGRGVYSEARVYAIYEAPDGKIYIGGSFDYVGGIRANNAAMFDGNEWHTLGNGFSRPINTIVGDSLGNVYYGGDYSAGTLGGVWKWDGSSWSVVGTGTNGDVKTLLLNDNGELIAGGEFSYAGGTRTGPLAVWDGTQWDNPWPRLIWTIFDPSDTTILDVEDLALGPNGDLYVAGGFGYAIDSTELSNLARWDGNDWHPIGTSALTEGTNSRVNAIAIDSAGTVYVGGFFSKVNNNTQEIYRLAKFDSSGWSAFGPLESPAVPNDIYIAESGDIYVVGLLSVIDGDSIRNVAKWDGTNWSTFGNGSGSTLQTIRQLSTGELLIGVDFQGSTPGPKGLGIWDGTEWEPFNGGVIYNSRVDKLALDTQKNLYAGGRFFMAGNIPARESAVWDGQKWNNSPGNLEVSSYRDMLVDSKGKMYVRGGSAVGDGMNTRESFVWWNGITWAKMPLTVSDLLIREIALDKNDNLYAVGNFTTNDGAPSNYVMQWNPAIFAWRAVGNGPSEPAENIAIGNNGEIFVGDEILEKWDGNQWISLIDSQQSIVAREMLVDHANNLYVVGEVSDSNDVQTCYVSKLDEFGWTCINEWGDRRSHTMLGIDSLNNVYFQIRDTGDFTLSLQRWNGVVWDTIDPNVMAPGVYDAIEAPSGGAYFGGWFAQLGGRVTSHIIQWNPPCASYSDTLVVFTDSTYTSDQGNIYSPEAYYRELISTQQGCDSIVTLKVLSSQDSVSTYTDKMELGGVSIYPNPSKGNFTVAFDQTPANSTLLVWNMQGQLIHEIFAKDKNKVQLEIDGPKGLYILEIIRDRGRRTPVKIIKE